MGVSKSKITKENGLKDIPKPIPANILEIILRQA